MLSISGIVSNWVGAGDGVGLELFSFGVEHVDTDASFSASLLSFFSAISTESDSQLAMESLVPGLGASALPKGSKYAERFSSFRV